MTENLKIFREKFSLIDSLSADSTTGNINFRFYFIEGQHLLKRFHFKMFLILKKFIEKLITNHKSIKHQKFNLDILIFTLKMNDQELGSAHIHKYIKDDNKILPTKALMKINSNYLSDFKKDIVNLRLIQTLFHELIHCLGFGYWELFNKKEFIINKNINLPKGLYYYKKIIGNYELPSIPMSEETHFSNFNKPIIKDNKIIGILPGLKYEIMSVNDTYINIFSKITAGILEELGYTVNYHLCDNYYFTALPDKLYIEYSHPTPNHFAHNLEKYILLLKSDNVIVSGIETFSMLVDTTYTIINKHEFDVYVVSELGEEEKFLLTEEQGVVYNDKEIMITPNFNTPNIFYIVSSITFAGIPIVKREEDINNINCFNKQSLKRLIDIFILN